ILLPPILFFSDVMSWTSPSLAMTSCFFFGVFSPEAFFSAFLFFFDPFFSVLELMGVSTCFDLYVLVLLEVGLSFEPNVKAFGSTSSPDGFNGVLVRSKLRSFSWISDGMFVVVSDGGIMLVFGGIDSVVSFCSFSWVLSVNVARDGLTCGSGFSEDCGSESLGS
ncbi:hypothetical protein A2U01_0027025, partial [Trifolium medium]|nr:hypothetical protein [Trifolium medium]